MPNFSFPHFTFTFKNLYAIKEMHIRARGGWLVGEGARQ